jgi:uncharacterized protein HemX
MENFNKVDLSFMQSKLASLEEQVERLNSYVDQKFDELAGSIYEVESRINNLR